MGVEEVRANPIGREMTRLKADEAVEEGVSAVDENAEKKFVHLI